jgi:hypothetical protein
LSTIVTTTIALTVQVTNQGGDPQAGIPIYAFDGTTYTGKNGVTNTNGEVTFTLQQGDYRFRADNEGVQYWSSDANHCSIPGCLQTEIVLPGGILAVSNVITYTYDSLYRLVSADYVNFDTGENGHSFSYTYDSAGNRLTKEECLVGYDCLTKVYNYDAANRITDGIVWSPNGEQLAFRTTAGGSSDIWIADLATGELQQITQDANAGYPVWLSQEGAENP